MDQDMGPPRLALGGPVKERGRLLVVEDDSIFRILLHEVLQARPWSVRFVSTLEEAAQELGHWQPHLVLTDLHLPDGRGAEAVRRLLAAGAASVVAMTGAPDAPEARDAVAAGAAACLSKGEIDTQLCPWLVG